MFTGLIQKVGKLERLEKARGGAVVTVSHDPWDEPLVPGESVAVQGVCLSVVRAESKYFACDVLSETLKRTNLGATARGTLLNLERALRAGDRMGGHFVSGHVDGVGKVKAVTAAVRDWILNVECGEALARGIVMKGSIACDGVSLTVTAVSRTGFGVNLIPLTWQNTSLRRLKAGDAVNVETDLIGKHVRRYLETGKPESHLTLDRLREMGFA
jgi:riboflavin synthase